MYKGVWEGCRGNLPEARSIARLPRPTDVGRLGPPWPQKTVASLGLQFWRLVCAVIFILNFFFFLVKVGFSPTPLQSEIRSLTDQQAEKITEERF